VPESHGTIRTYRESYDTGCVEVGDAAPTIAVRDTKDRDGVTLTVSAEAWQAFTAALR
jgi:hypothetical protein